jgi:release factor glutamine methyltransferase
MKNNLTVAEWLDDANKVLNKAGIDSARLDTLILLEEILEIDRVIIMAHPETLIPKTKLKKLSESLKRRTAREPMAYITGHKEFYCRDFLVTKDVLIPRPDSEAFFELLATYQPKPKDRLLDLGCGCGNLAIAAKLEYPELDVEAIDVSKKALVVARLNADKLRADVKFYRSEINNLKQPPYDFILANLPYLPEDLVVSKEILCEPPEALFAPDNGLAIITKSAKPAFDQLKAGGYILIESLAIQHETIKHIYENVDFIYQTNLGLIQSFRKI